MWVSEWRVVLVEAVVAATAAARGSEEVAHRVRRSPRGWPPLGTGGVGPQDEAQDAAEPQEDGCVRARAGNREGVLGGYGLARPRGGHGACVVRNGDKEGDERGKYIWRRRLCLLPAAARTEQLVGLARARDAEVVVERSTICDSDGGRRRSGDASARCS